jgi:hypothetical protein
VQLTDLLAAFHRVWNPPPARTVWVTDKPTMLLCYWQDMTHCWHRALVEEQIRTAAAQLRGKLWKKANGLGTSTVLRYLDRESNQYLTLDLDGFRISLSENFILKEFKTGIQYGGPNKTFAAKLYDEAVSTESTLQWV